MIETSNSVSTSKTTNIDQWGRPTEYQQITDGNTYTSSYQYNLSGALIEETYPSGRVVKNQFDNNGDVARVYGKADPNAIERTYANSFNYTASGGITSMKLGNGRWETAKFNNRLQVDELGLGNSATDTSTWKVNYEFGEYDPNTQTISGSKNTGNIARQTVSFNGLPNAFVQTYQYDSLYRLTNANEMAGTTQTENWKQEFTYDRYGNRLTHNKFINGNQISQTVETHPNISSATNRFTNIEYGYDKVGNLTSDAEGRSFTFDGNNKQILVTDVNNQAVGEYFYDGDGMRVKKKIFTGGVHSKTVIFVYSGGKLIEEYATDPPQNPKTKYLTEDHLGTPRVITDQNGQVVSRRDFMPFGEQIANTTGTRSDNSFKYSSNEDDVKQKFTGYQQDSETMLDFAEARMYENRHARFTAVDPLLASGNSANPQTFNRFVYVLNSPLTLTDPSGLCPEGEGREECLARAEPFCTGCTPAFNDAGTLRVFQNGETIASGFTPITYAQAFTGASGRNYWLTPTSSEKFTPSFLDDMYTPNPLSIYTGQLKALPRFGIDSLNFASMAAVFDNGRNLNFATQFSTGQIPQIPMPNSLQYSDWTEAISGGAFELTLGAISPGKGANFFARSGPAAPKITTFIGKQVIRNIESYEIAGSFGRIGKTYTANIWGLYGTIKTSTGKFRGNGFKPLVKVLEKEALKSGASRINILGTHIANPDILKNMNLLKRAARQSGYTFKQIDKQTIILSKSLN